MNTSNNLDILSSTLQKDKKEILEYYRSTSNKTKFNNWIRTSGILNFIKRLFVFDYDNKEFSLSDSIFLTVTISFIQFILNSCLLKLGYNYEIYPIIILILILLLLCYIIVNKFQTILTCLLIYFFSIFYMNNLIYNSSKEGTFKQSYQTMIIDNNLDKNQFFIENLQTYKNNKLKLIRHD